MRERPPAVILDMAAGGRGERKQWGRGIWTRTASRIQTLLLWIVGNLGTKKKKKKKTNDLVDREVRCLMLCVMEHACEPNSGG